MIFTERNSHWIEKNQRYTEKRHATQTVNIQKGGRETHTHHCLAKTNGTFTTNRCEALKMYTCDGGRYFNLHFRRIKLKH